jgi:endo-1,4-beta-mannosidase
MSEPFVLGVNYWPRRKAMSWWSDFDAGEVREEFAQLSKLGLQVVRIFLLWDDWQPTPDSVSRECVAHFGKVCDAAAAQGLGLDVTFFTGHMSGPNWAPGWMLRGKPEPGARPLVSGGRIAESGYANYFTDARAREAQRLLLRSVVSAYKDHPAIWMWNLGNEPDLFAIAPDQESGRRWTREMVDIVKTIDPVHPVTLGLHGDSLRFEHPQRVDYTFAETDVAVMHSYPMYVPWARSPLDPDFVPAACALTTALSGKPTLMEEFGGCTVGPGEPSTVWEWTSMGEHRTQFMASEEDFAEYMAAVLPKLVEVGATGAMTWCFADYVPELWDRPPCDEFKHERFFGLVRPDGSLKPHAKVVRDFAATRPTVQPARRKMHLGVTPDEFYQSPETHYRRLYEQWVGPDVPIEGRQR